MHCQESCGGGGKGPHADGKGGSCPSSTRGWGEADSRAPAQRRAGPAPKHELTRHRGPARKAGASATAPEPATPNCSGKLVDAPCAFTPLPRCPRGARGHKCTHTGRTREETSTPVSARTRVAHARAKAAMTAERMGGGSFGAMPTCAPKRLLQSTLSQHTRTESDTHINT